MGGTGTILRASPGQAGVAPAARCDGAGDHALPFTITADGGSQFLDHAYRLVANGEAFRDRVLAFQDVYVGAADGGGRDTNERIERADLRDWLVG